MTCDRFDRYRRAVGDVVASPRNQTTTGGIADRDLNWRLSGPLLSQAYSF